VSREISKAAQLLALADLLERWAEALPRGHVQGSERWDVFLDRVYEAEMALAERLRALPTCRLSMCPFREKVTLALAGVRVRTECGLAGACCAWARAVRARVEVEPSHE
jgi:aminoglycoside phosphotransferase